jgi:hypothetical protein
VGAVIRRIGGALVAVIFLLILMAEVRDADERLLEQAEQQRLELTRQ